MAAMKKVMLVFGTRPEAIKMAPVVRELHRYPGEIKPIVCVTAQHRHMLDQVLALFEIEPDIDLDLMEQDQSLPALTASATLALTQVVLDVQPDLILVQGDTSTAMVAALVGFYHKIPIGHIEAGLRTSDLYHPFPEEVNRRIISVIATFNFAPTQTAVDALLREGIPAGRAFLTGNTVIDALFLVLREARAASLEHGIPLNCERFILVTAHRRENFGQPLENICWALRQLAARHPDLEIVYPVHLNPRVQESVRHILGNQERIHLIEPVRYEQFVGLMSRAYLVLTDSGGIQEEAPALGKPVLVLRDITERPEALAAGVVKVIGTETDVIVTQTEQLLTDRQAYERMSRVTSPYGDGHAAERIVQTIRCGLISGLDVNS
jgi:UDP-N-acetylglucosamine 2-epimerase (non-hydrolysing)